MKKKIFILPLVLALLVLTLVIILVWRAIFVQEAWLFVGDDGRYQNICGDILGLTHSWFVLLIGAVCAVVMAAVRRKQYGLTIAQTIIFSVMLAIQAVVGAKVLFGIERVMGGNEFNMSGLSLFGGVFFTLMFTPIMARIFKKDTAMLFDFVAPLGMILIASARMGCFFAHCCGAKAQMINGRPFYWPVQLFEVILDLSVLAVLLYWEQNKLNWAEKNRKVNAYNGILALTILACYGTYRFMLEFLRDTPKDWLGMSNGQVYSLICLGVSIWLFVLHMQNHAFALKKVEENKKRHPRKR